MQMASQKHLESLTKGGSAPAQNMGMPSSMMGGMGMPQQQMGFPMMGSQFPQMHQQQMFMPMQFAGQSSGDGSNDINSFGPVIPPNF